MIGRRVAKLVLHLMKEVIGGHQRQSKAIRVAKLVLHLRPNVHYRSAGDVIGQVVVRVDDLRLVVRILRPLDKHGAAVRMPLARGTNDGERRAGELRALPALVVLDARLVPDDEGNHVRRRSLIVMRRAIL